MFYFFRICSHEVNPHCCKIAAVSVNSWCYPSPVWPTNFMSKVIKSPCVNYDTVCDITAKTEISPFKEENKKITPRYWGLKQFQNVDT